LHSTPYLDVCVWSDKLLQALNGAHEKWAVGGENLEEEKMSSQYGTSKNRWKQTERGPDLEKKLASFPSYPSPYTSRFPKFISPQDLC
jgi:hypothetical protein